MLKLSIFASAAILAGTCITKPAEESKPLCVDGIVFDRFEDLNGNKQLGWRPDIQGKPTRCEEER